HRKIGILKLETADPRAEPRPPETGGGIDGQHLSLIAVERCESIVHRGERGADCGKQSLSRFRKPHAAFLPNEQRMSEPVFQLANLIADRGLRHPELLGSAREILQPSSGF